MPDDDSSDSEDDKSFLLAQAASRRANNSTKQLGSTSTGVSSMDSICLDTESEAETASMTIKKERTSIDPSTSLKKLDKKAKIDIYTKMNARIGSSLSEEPMASKGDAPKTAADILHQAFKKALEDVMLHIDRKFHDQSEIIRSVETKVDDISESTSEINKRLSAQADHQILGLGNAPTNNEFDESQMNNEGFQESQPFIWVEAPVADNDNRQVEEEEENLESFEELLRNKKKK
ncbi:hypothetical protein QAD02_013432 [Eretmocerus hayati]|uniref:Uncharacterized protein n=1 Tax=Eretmocerus hayati TaxID=131215 RepID=A0ACC2P2L1_9HYME|nr:hypothetical protein QAD02_013432 [Eretmocerus hayati]